MQGYLLNVACVSDGRYRSLDALRGPDFRAQFDRICGRDLADPIPQRPSRLRIDFGSARDPNRKAQRLLRKLWLPIAEPMRLDVGQQLLDHRHRDVTPLLRKQHLRKLKPNGKTLSA